MFGGDMLNMYNQVVDDLKETNNENIRLTAENIELNLELQRKDNIINELKQNKRDYERENILEMKLHILDNNWNELKEWIENMIFNKVGSSVDIAIENHVYCKMLDKIKELEESNENRKCS